MLRHQLTMTSLGVTLCVLALTPGNARAGEEPYMSVRTGMRCSQCHVNRTGGGGRNAFGTMYAQTRLSMGKSTFQNRMLNDFVAVGGNFRLLASGFVSEAEPQTAVSIGELNVQVEARVVPDVLAFYVDQTLGPGGASTREGFMLLERLPLDGYLKVGKFLLPYGLRLVDDAEYIRQRTGFSYTTPDIGVELGVEPGPLSLFIAVSNGTQGAEESNDGKQITGTAALILPRFRLGASASRNDGPSSRLDVVGGFGGFNLGRLTVLGEVDLMFDDSPDIADLAVPWDKFAAYVEGDFLLVPGLNTKVTYGFFDPDGDIGENAEIRMRFGIEAFPMQFLQVSGFYTLHQDIPQATSDMDRLSVEFHLYF